MKALTIRTTGLDGVSCGCGDHVRPAVALIAGTVDGRYVERLACALLLGALTVCNSCDAATADPTSPAGYCADCDADAGRPDDCDHRPNDAGTSCRWCGVAATPVSPAELAVALDLELVIVARRRQLASLS